MTALRYADIVLLALALPIFILADLPALGWGAAALGWLAQRGVQLYANRRARDADDPRVTVGVLAGSMIARGWMVAIIIFLAGLQRNDAGLAAAVLTVALFTLYFTIGIVLRPFDPSGRPPREPRAPLQPNGGAR